MLKWQCSQLATNGHFCSSLGQQKKTTERLRFYRRNTPKCSGIKVSLPGHRVSKYPSIQVPEYPSIEEYRVIARRGANSTSSGHHVMLGDSRHRRSMSVIYDFIKTAACCYLAANRLLWFFWPTNGPATCKQQK